MDCAQKTLAFSDCYDESVFNASTPIKADPDIAGVGVISAFIIAAGLALLFTYIYILINEVAWFRERVDVKRWSTIIEQFVFSLSDQQLVTGLAVLIAGFARWDEISIYHWEIITDLAFVSSNTHLATLVVLRRQFREKKKRWTRWIRVVAMVALAIMLFVANTYTGYYRWSDDAAWPMRCVAVAFKCDLSYNYKGEPRRLAIVCRKSLCVDAKFCGSQCQQPD